MENKIKKKVQSFNVAELIVPKTKGKGNTQFETFTIGKETFRIVKEKVEQKYNQTFANKVEYLRVIIGEFLQDNGCNKVEVQNFIEHWNK